MEPKTIDQILADLVLAARQIPPAQRLSFDEVMRLAHTPMGGLKNPRRKN
jgi:hypothetical protein